MVRTRVTTTKYEIVHVVLKFFFEAGHFHTPSKMIAENEYNLAQCVAYDLPYILIDGEYSL